MNGAIFKVIQQIKLDELFVCLSGHGESRVADAEKVAGEVLHQ